MEFSRIHNVADFYNSKDSTPIAEPVFKKDLYVYKLKAKAIEMVDIRILAGQELYSHIKKELMCLFVQKY